MAIEPKDIGVDAGAIFSMFVNGLLHPREAYSAHMPTLSEMTCGLLGKSFKPDRDIGDLSGKVILVTGGNSGIGQETVFQFARHQPKRIYVAARSQEKSNKLIESVKKELTKSIDIRHLPLDLASFPSIKNAVQTFTSENTRLDILILNAGVMALPAGTTEAGHEIQFGINYVGHFLLTKLLLPTLLKTALEPDADVRLVTVSSTVSGIAPPLEDWFSTEKMNKYNTFYRYAASKAASIAFTTELARRHPEIMAVSLHPGVVVSDLWATINNKNPILTRAIALTMRTPKSGAHNQLWTATVSRDKLINGTYYNPVGNAQKHKIYTTKVEWAKKLWEWSEAETNQATA